MSIFARVRAALTKLPRRADWQRLIFELLWLAPVLALCGWLGQLVQASEVDFAYLVRTAAIALVVPALMEEIFFRAVLLPAPASQPSVFRCALAIAAFVLWHPLQTLWFGAAWGEVVLNFWFLVAVAALGITTTRLYLATTSLWPAVILHWSVVVTWKALGGVSPWS